MLMLDVSLALLSLVLLLWTVPTVWRNVVHYWMDIKWWFRPWWRIACGGYLQRLWRWRRRSLLPYQNEGWTWCCHHDEELEYCHDFEGRVQYILENKRVCELGARLREFRFVKHPERLPQEVLSAQAKGDFVTLCAHLKEHKDAINALHREEFPETSWDGKSIFSWKGGVPW